MIKNQSAISKDDREILSNIDVTYEEWGAFLIILFPFHFPVMFPLPLPVPPFQGDWGDRTSGQPLGLLEGAIAFRSVKCIFMGRG